MENIGCSWSEEMRRGSLVAVAVIEISQWSIRSSESWGRFLHLALVGTGNLQTEVLGLHRGELGQLGVDVFQVATSDLLVQSLGQDVDTDGLLATFAELNVLATENSILGLEQGDLSKDLVGEGAGHDE